VRQTKAAIMASARSCVSCGKLVLIAGEPEPETVICSQCRKQIKNAAQNNKQDTKMKTEIKTSTSTFVTDLLAERDKQHLILEGIATLLNRYGYEEPKPEPQIPPATNEAGPKGPRLRTVLVKIYKAAGKPLTPEEAHAEALKENSKWTLQDVKDRLKTFSMGSNGKPPLFKEIQDGCYESAQAQAVTAPAA
jgi:hypothetical protein